MDLSKFNNYNCYTLYFCSNIICISSDIRMGLVKKGKKMTPIIISILMGIIFLFIFINQFFALQKEVKKLKSITSHLLKEIKSLKDQNVK